MKRILLFLGTNLAIVLVPVSYTHLDVYKRQAYGLADVVNQRRMIDESPAVEAFKRNQRGKLDALLSLAEAHDCRRVRLLAYFGEASAACGVHQNACDNCLNPPATWDATEAARKALSLSLIHILSARLSPELYQQLALGFRATKDPAGS